MRLLLRILQHARPELQQWALLPGPASRLRALLGTAEPVPLKRRGFGRVNDTVYYSQDTRRYVIVRSGLGATQEGKLIPSVTAYALSGEPAGSRLNTASDDSQLQKLRFDTPIFYGKQARKRYDVYVEAMKRAGNEALILPFEEVPSKPEEPEAPPPPSDVATPEEADVVIRHSAAEGTTATWDQGADRGRGQNASIYHVIRSGGFVAAHRAGGIYRRTNSVGLMETRAPIAVMVDQLHERGFKVFLSLGTADVATALAHKRQYLEERAEHMAGRSEKLSREAESRGVRAEQLQEKATTHQDIPGFFPTGADLAKEVVALADVEEGQVILEPSAGHGALIRAILEAAPTATVDAIEIAPALRTLLRNQGVAVVAEDALDPGFSPGTLYDRVVMNPPFENGAALEHVQNAFTFLRPGGRLVAVVPESVLYREDRAHQAFRDWVSMERGTFHDVERQKFGRAGAIKTRVLVLDKEENALEEPGGALTLSRIEEARAAAQGPTLKAPRSTREVSQQDRDRARELMHKNYQQGLDRAERAELGAIQVAARAWSVGRRAERIARKARHISAVDVSKGGRTAVAPARHSWVSQTSNVFLQAMQERIRKIKSATGATKLARGWFDKKSISYELHWSVWKTSGRGRLLRIVVKVPPGEIVHTDEAGLKMGHKASASIPENAAFWYVEVSGGYQHYILASGLVDPRDPDEVYARLVAALNGLP